MNRWSSRQIVGAALVAWLIVGGLALVSGPPLAHDEAAYAIAARGNAPAWNYRSSGMIGIAKIGLAFGGSDIALRVVALVLGAGLIVTTFALGRVAYDGRTGAWAAAVLATAHPMASRSAELIGDLPATALLLAGTAILLGELQRDRVRWWLVLCAPLYAGAFYVRYGSAPVLALIALLAVVLYARQLARWPVLVTVLVFGACLVPHVQRSLEITGSPLGILSAAAAMPRRAYIGEGLVTYVTANPFRFYGAIVAPVMLAGVLGVFVRLHRAQLFIVCTALGQLVVLGMQSHAQPRYVFFATALLVIAGVDALREYASERIAAGVIALAWLGLAIAIVPFQHYVARLRAPLYAAARTVQADARGRPCAIAANVVPQLIWLTGCEVVVAHSLPDVADPWPRVRVKYMVSTPHAVLSKRLFDAVVAKTTAVSHELVVANPDSRVWRLDSR